MHIPEKVTTEPQTDTSFVVSEAVRLHLSHLAVKIAREKRLLLQRDADRGDGND